MLGLMPSCAWRQKFSVTCSIHRDTMLMNDNVVCVIQAEKRKMLMEHETQKIKELEEQYSNELREWKAMLIPRKQVCSGPTNNAFVGPYEMILRLTKAGNYVTFYRTTSFGPMRSLLV